MANAWTQDRARWFYLGFGIYCLAAVFVGFSTTYILPLSSGTFDGPVIVHLHGAVALGWVALFFVQTTLVRNNRSRVHRKLGYAGIPVAVGVLVTGVGTAIWATKRDLAASSFALTIPIGTLTSLLIFTAFVVYAVAMRRRPDWHKRLMMLATVVVLWPAFFRFRHLVPWVPHPDIWLGLVLADLPILVAAARDRIIYGHVHPVWKIFGTLLIAEQSLEALFLFETPLWQDLGEAIYRLLS